MEITSKINLRQTGIVTWTIFLITLGVVIISSISIVFPALLIRSFGGFEDNLGINSLEPGIWAFPLLIANFIIFGLTILYSKGKLPKTLTNSIKFIFNFEVSNKVTFFVLVIVIGSYIALSVEELFNGEFLPDFYLRDKEALENFKITEVVKSKGFGHHLQLFLQKTSYDLFANYKVIPFIASISLLVLTYFVTLELTKKRFAGIVSMLIVLQSQIFLFYDTFVVYPPFWILFYLLSLFLICKKWPISPIVWVIAVLSKSLTLVFLPMTFFFIYRANISKQKKIRVAISYGITIVIFGIFLSMANLQLGPYDIPITDFKPHEFWVGFAAINSSLKQDGLVLTLLLPLTVGLFIASRRRIVHADTIMFLILSMLLSAPLLIAFSEHHNLPYRFIPLIVFFAIGVGLLLSKKINEKAEQLSKLH